MTNQYNFNNKIKVVLIPIGWAMFIALGIVFVATSFFADFFFIDDAQNDLLPFFREIGRIILSKHSPVLTTNVFLGGNILVDMAYSPFSPQTLITGLLATQINSLHFLANFIAWMNLTLVILGAFWLGRILKISTSYSLLLGFIVATSPVFLYLYLASWWNFASAFAWFAIGFPALLQFRINQGPGEFIIAGLTLCFLFATAGTHLQVAYILGFFVIVYFDFLQHRSISRIIKFIMVGLCAGLISAIPLMSEYFLNNVLIERESGFYNNGNFLVPTWGQLVNFFNPFYGTYMNWFGGYRFMPIPIGYLGIISLILIFTFNSVKDYSKSYKIVLSLAIISFLLSFSSSQFGPLRWPFRYLAVLSMMFSTIIVYHIEKSTFKLTKENLKWFIGFVLIAAFIQLFSAETKVFTWSRMLFVQLFLVLSFGLISYVYLVNDNHKVGAILVLWFISISSWVGMLGQTNTLGATHLGYSNIPEKISGLSADNSSFSLGLTHSINQKKSDVADFNSGQFLLFGIKSINGYSPVGHAGIRRIFPHVTAHGLFPPAETLINISQPTELQQDVFTYQLMNIGRIWAWRADVTPEIATRLTSAGLMIEPYPVGDRLIIKPKFPNKNEGTMTFQSAGLSITFDHDDGMLHEWFNVAESNAERVLIFSRVYWFGYHAIINGVAYPVSSYKNALVKVVLPPGVSGSLHLYYEPVSWKYTKWILLLGICLFLATVYRLMTKKDNFIVLSET